jgi:hypothetical protein
MAKPDAEIEQALKTYSLGLDACWLHKQSGKYILSHWACENIAIQEGVQWEQPSVICADPAGKIATLCVTGKLGDRVEWSFGEAAPYNTTQAYPFAMAEKRAKDRVVLKLIGLSGKVYSEEEAEDFKKPDPVKAAISSAVTQEPPPKKDPLQPWKGPLSKSALTKELRKLTSDLALCEDLSMLNSCLSGYQGIIEQLKIDVPEWWNGEPDGNGFTPLKQRIEDREALVSIEPQIRKAS